VEIAKRFVDAFNRRDLNALMDTATPDIAFSPALARTIDDNRFQGREGMRAYFADVDSAWEEFREERSGRVRVALELVASIRVITRQADELQRELRSLIMSYRPALLAEQGLGVLTAATLIGRTAGAERFPTDAHFARQAGVAPIPVSSGRKDRHRLHRGGDRQLNRALHTIAVTRARIDPQTRAYLERKRAEGKSRREALRCLKRHLARQVHHLLSMPPTTPEPKTRIQLNSAISVPCLT
jgi:transposase